mmetsp:Transcript_85563/g.261702  ORF Transcript_85563/g.261702 Transcript_85563/m.261702 type:complete len:245 (-) Transcript_85563:335-1069(-)
MDLCSSLMAARRAMPWWCAADSCFASMTRRCFSSYSPRTSRSKDKPLSCSARRSSLRCSTSRRRSSVTSRSAARTASKALAGSCTLLTWNRSSPRSRRSASGLRLAACTAPSMSAASAPEQTESSHRLPRSSAKPTPLAAIALEQPAALRASRTARARARDSATACFCFAVFPVNPRIFMQVCGDSFNTAAISSAFFFPSYVSRHLSVRGSKSATCIGWNGKGSSKTFPKRALKSGWSSAPASP